MQTIRYSRKPLIVDAVQVTEENMLEVAKWCKGKVYSEPKQKGAMVIEVKVLHPLSSNQNTALPGDWILKSNQGFKIYADSAFKKGFETLEDDKPLVQNMGDVLREKLGTDLQFQTPAS